MTAATRAAGALALGGLVVVLDTTVAVLALPVLVREFDASLSTVQRLTTGYLLALVATMPLAAWLGARFGERRVWCAALLVFVAGSVWAGVAGGIGELVAELGVVLRHHLDARRLHAAGLRADHRGIEALVSADLSQVVRPTRSQRNETVHQPVLGGGSVLELNSHQTCPTDAISGG